jgi:chromosome segregation ATPase
VSRQSEPVQLEQQLGAAKADSDQTIAALKSEHRQQVEALQAALSAQEAAFRLEIDKATERLEGVQRHVMLQVTEARDAQKRSEAQLSKSKQKNEQLLVEVQHLGRQIAAMAQTAERAQADLNQAHDELARLRAERESLVQQVAAAGGKLNAFGDQIEALERRAVGAETRLEEALQRPAVQKKRTIQPSQKRKTIDKSFD